MLVDTQPAMSAATRLAICHAVNTRGAYPSWIDMGRRVASMRDRRAAREARSWFDHWFPKGSAARGDMRNDYGARAIGLADRTYGNIDWIEVARSAAEDAAEVVA